MAKGNPTATVIEMKPEDYDKSRTRLITFFAQAAVVAGTTRGWSEDTMHDFALASLSAFELGCHMGMHNPDIAETWALILGGGSDEAERWQVTHQLSHEVSSMFTGELVAHDVPVGQAVELVNRLNERTEGENNGKPN